MKNKYPKGFEMIPETAGKISNGIFINKKTCEIIVAFAWGGDYHFKISEIK